MQTPLRQCGFTLIEMLSVVAIVAILASIATPSIRALTAGQNVRSTASDLHTALVKARSEAIKRNAPVSLSPAASGSWVSGWTIPNPANTAVLLDSHGAVPNVTISGPTAVVFNPSGRIQGSGTAQFDIAAAGTDKRRCVKVDLSGRAYELNTAC
ncbi:GspH/FimT family pseudopilin [Massilia sp. TS11]|uniref:GspH/FimT family pseudopilin n=1 Tax=Massilia sp. TS11 TaxID=2908003 RepID=UPI001EDBDDB5|nr:GspH/FimT family pseudopilin [Massilia sp. TS11]MCG2584056.1 GspH/FimT family pseudopilin [Massilia sp. TS11]